MCTKNGNTSLCSCEEGFEFAEDGVTCKTGKIVWFYGCLCIDLQYSTVMCMPDLN